VAAHLSERGITSFVPVFTEVHQWSDRRKVVQQPLFSCYTFVQMAPRTEPRHAVLRTPGVIGFVGIAGMGIPISKKEIDDIKTLATLNTPYGPHPYLTVGKRVRVLGGCLEGIEGILVAKNSDYSLIVSIELIQRSVVVRLDGYNVQPV